MDWRSHSRKLLIWLDVDSVAVPVFRFVDVHIKAELLDLTMLEHQWTSQRHNEVPLQDRVLLLKQAAQYMNTFRCPPEG